MSINEITLPVKIVFIIMLTTALIFAIILVVDIVRIKARQKEILLEEELRKEEENHR